MKKQMKSSLSAIAVGLSLLSAVLISAGDNTTVDAVPQPQALEARQVTAPVAENTAAKPSKLPATFYLSLISCMASGGFIDANIFIPEKQASIWGKNSEWTPER